MSQLERFAKYTKESAAKARVEDNNAGWLKLNPGTNVIRLLPPLVGMAEPWVSFVQHFIKGAGDSKIVFNCPRKMGNGRCPACEKVDRLKATGNPADEKIAKGFYASNRNVGFALSRDTPDLGVQIFGFGSTVKKRLRHFREKLNIDFTDLMSGRDLVIEKMGDGMDIEYQVDLGEAGPVFHDMKKFEAMLDALPDLNDFTKVLSYDTILEKFAGITGGGAPPSNTRAIAAPATSRRSASTNVQDDDGDDTGSGDQVPF